MLENMAEPVHPLTCIFWDEFKDIPSMRCGLFQSNDQNGSVHDPNQVTVMNRILAEDAKWKFHINTVEDLDEVKNKLMNRFLAFHMYSGIKSGKEHNFDEFVLLVNTAHKEISSTLEAKFGEMKELVVTGEIFRFKIDFGDSVGSTYPKLYGSKGPFFPGQKSKSFGASFFITNQQPSNKCFNCCSPLCIICFPVFSCIMPCYRIHRQRTRKNECVKFSTPVDFQVYNEGCLLSIHLDAQTGVETIMMTVDGVSAAVARPEACMEYMAKMVNQTAVRLIPPKEWRDVTPFC